MTNVAALIIATTLLVLIPGPNVALIVANSLKHGLREGVVTVLGTTLGVGLQLLLVVAGLSAIIEQLGEALTWIRWAGVAYLIFLGIRSWREPVADLSRIEATPAVFWRGFILAAVNPKTLLFNAAFLPQFVSNGTVTQISLVAAVFLGVILAGDTLWALFASSASRFLRRYNSWRNKITGVFLGAAGVGLALARR
ncbi:MAG: LysE family translocator [Gammaproteobacteria bacterium]|nr:LysE family translocator [Gammaproteobacteria bacterium]